MSHQPLRTEKDCLNCGTVVAERYCQHCGQENIVAKQSAWSLIMHFVYDVLHFDGKFFLTLKYLFTKPGFVPLDVTQGKRMRYLDPIRMYLFSSAIFFLVFFASHPFEVNMGSSRFMTKAQRYDYYTRLRDTLTTSDTAARLAFADSILSPRNIVILSTKKDTSHRPEYQHFNHQGQVYNVSFRPRKRSDKADDDAESRIGGIELSRLRKMKEESGDDEEGFIREASKVFLHNLPYVLFVSLPFFALILKLLYFRRKSLFYSDHAVFTLYHYILSFILLLLVFLSVFLQDVTGWGVLDFLNFIFLTAGGVYLFLAMRRFYKQGWWKTFFKFLVLNIVGMVTLFLVIVLFVIVSFI